VYHPDHDIYSCPAGKILRKRSYYKKRTHYEYRAPRGVCALCRLQPQCTRAKDGRTLKRHNGWDALDIMLKGVNTP